jgi:hypothetical protein
MKHRVEDVKKLEIQEKSGSYRENYLSQWLSWAIEVLIKVGLGWKVGWEQDERSS